MYICIARIRKNTGKQVGCTEIIKFYKNMQLLQAENKSWHHVIGPTLYSYFDNQSVSVMLVNYRKFFIIFDIIISRHDIVSLMLRNW